MEGGPPGFPQDFSCPTVLGIPLGAANVRLPGCHRLWRAIPGRFGFVACSHIAVPQPRRSKLHRFGLAPVRSPLLGGSRLLSLPPGTEMFQFPGFAPVLPRVTDVTAGRVSPFGHPGITAHVQLPQAYRSLSRPSSPLGAKASTVRRMVLDLIDQETTHDEYACYSNSIHTTHIHANHRLSKSGVAPHRRPPPTAD